MWASLIRAQQDPDDNNLLNPHPSEADLALGLAVGTRNPSLVAELSVAVLNGWLQLPTQGQHPGQICITLALASLTRGYWMRFFAPLH